MKGEQRRREERKKKRAGFHVVMSLVPRHAFFKAGNDFIYKVGDCQKTWLSYKKEHLLSKERPVGLSLECSNGRLHECVCARARARVCVCVCERV